MAKFLVGCLGAALAGVLIVCSTLAGKALFERRNVDDIKMVLDFVESAISSLAWPVTALVIAWLFRRPILALIPQIKELSLPGGFAAKFGEELREVVVDDEEPYVAMEPPPTPDRVLYSLRMDPDSTIRNDDIKANPTGAIMTAYERLIGTARMLMIQADPNRAFVKHSVTEMLEILSRDDLISTKDVSAIVSLQMLRNSAAHAREKVAESDARYFVDLVDRLVKKLEKQIVGL